MLTYSTCAKITSIRTPNRNKLAGNSFRWIKIGWWTEDRKQVILLEVGPKYCNQTKMFSVVFHAVQCLNLYLSLYKNWHSDAVAQLHSVLLGSLRSLAHIDYHVYTGDSQITIAFDGRTFILLIRHSIKCAGKLRCHSVSKLAGACGGWRSSPVCGLTIILAVSSLKRGQNLLEEWYHRTAFCKMIYLYFLTLFLGCWLAMIPAVLRINGTLNSRAAYCAFCWQSIVASQALLL